VCALPCVPRLMGFEFCAQSGALPHVHTLCAAVYVRCALFTAPLACGLLYCFIVLCGCACGEVAPLA
jgi:hypothetical protein